MRPILPKVIAGCAPLVVAIVLSGCAHGSGGSGKPPSDIQVGQHWSDAENAARAAGYDLYDATQLAWEIAPGGFYINLAGGRGLIVTRDAASDTVSQVKLVENWDGPKQFRMYHEIKSFHVPRARVSNR